jgi:hypothetical protein
MDAISSNTLHFWGGGEPGENKKNGRLINRPWNENHKVWISSPEN